MPSRDVNQEALRQVREATDDCESPTDEELLASPELRRPLREAEERLKSEPPNPPRLTRVRAGQSGIPGPSRGAVHSLRLAENLCFRAVGIAFVTKVLPNMKRISRKIARGDLDGAAHSFAHILDKHVA